MDLQSQFIYKQTIINLQKFTSTKHLHIITEMNDNINIYSFINQDYKLHGIWLYRININDKGSSWTSSHGVFTTTNAICVYHHWCCEFESRSCGGIQHYVITFVTWWLATGGWFSPGPPIFSTNKTDRHDIAEILLKVALNTINRTEPILS